MIDPVLLERLAAQVHDGWVACKAAQGYTSRRSETGEDLTAPYADLSEAAKDLDRCTVRTVLEALGAMPPTVTAETLPTGIVALVDARAGRAHSRTGPVLAAVADVINLWETLNGRLPDCHTTGDTDAS